MRARLSTTITTVTAIAVAVAGVGAVASEAAAETAAAAPCASRSVGVRTFTLPASSVRLLSGDRNFGGGGPAVTAWAKLEKWTVGSPGNFHDELRVRFGMRADETRSNWTSGEGETSVVLYRAPLGCRIDSARLPGQFDSNGYLAQRPGTPEPHNLKPGNSGINASFVTGYRVYAQHNGNDVGSYTRVLVSTKAVWVHFTG